MKPLPHYKHEAHRVRSAAGGYIAVFAFGIIIGLMSAQWMIGHSKAGSRIENSIILSEKENAVPETTRNGSDTKNNKQR